MRKLDVKMDGYHTTPTYAIIQSDYIDAKVLAAGVAETITVPASAKLVFFSCTGNFYIKYGAAAAIPAVDVTDGSAPALNPSSYIVEAADTLGVIAPADCVLTLEYYK